MDSFDSVENGVFSVDKLILILTVNGAINNRSVLYKSDFSNSYCGVGLFISNFGDKWFEIV